LNHVVAVQAKVKSDEEIKAYHRKRIAEKSAILVPAKLEEPSYDQKEWFNHKMKAPARCWETCIEHKPWILRWHYFILEDYKHGC
jgi:hypothetical protein